MLEREIPVGSTVIVLYTVNPYKKASAGSATSDGALINFCIQQVVVMDIPSERPEFMSGTENIPMPPTGEPGARRHAKVMKTAAKCAADLPAKPDDGTEASDEAIPQVLIHDKNDDWLWAEVDDMELWAAVGVYDTQETVQDGRT